MKLCNEFMKFCNDFIRTFCLEGVLCFERKTNSEVKLDSEHLFELATLEINAIFVIYLRTDKSYTNYLKLLSRFPNSQITAT